MNECRQICNQIESQKELSINNIDEFMVEEYKIDNEIPSLRKLLEYGLDLTNVKLNLNKSVFTLMDFDENKTHSAIGVSKNVIKFIHNKGHVMYYDVLYDYVFSENNKPYLNINFIRKVFIFYYKLSTCFNYPDHSVYRMKDLYKDKKVLILTDISHLNRDIDVPFDVIFTIDRQNRIDKIEVEKCDFV